jgi:hypothetical protein
MNSSKQVFCGTSRYFAGIFRGQMSPLAGILSGYFRWAAAREIDVRTYGHECARVLNDLIVKAGLGGWYQTQRDDGRIRPETLLFTAFGIPSHIQLVS